MTVPPRPHEVSGRANAHVAVMMNALKPLTIHTSPAGRPQPIAFLDGKLWVGCWETSTLYAIDPTSWKTTAEIVMPGVPYGVAAFEGVLRVVVSIGEADDRFIYRVVPGHPVDESGRVACPDHHGSHLTTDGSSLYLVQQTNRTLLRLGNDGTALRTVSLPTRCAGIGFAGGTCYMISADDEFDVLELATLDLAAPEPTLATIAPIDVEARGLTFDGTLWWTGLREKNEIASFEL